MQFFSKKRQSQLLNTLLSSNCEKYSLLLYIITYTIIIINSTYKIQDTSLNYYDTRQNLIKYHKLTNLQNVKSYDDIYTFVQQLLIEQLWVQKVASPMIPIGLVRMAQFRVSEQNCYFNQYCNETLSNYSSQACYLESKMSECNQFYQQSIKATSYIPSPNITCALQNCNEYQYRATNLTKYRGQLGDYSGSTFFVDFNFNQNTTLFILDQLQDNKWIDNFSRAIIIQWNVYNIWVNSYFIFTVSFETRGDQILVNQYTIYSVSASILWQTINSINYGIFVIILVVLSIRLLYLFSYELTQRFTLAIEVIQYFLNYAAFFTHYTNASFIKSLLQYQQIQNDQFYGFQKDITVWNLQLAFLGFGTLFLPFKLFQFLSHFHSFRKLIKLINNIYRIIPFIFTYALIILIVYWCWSDGSYILFNGFIYEFRDLYESFCFISSTKLYDTNPVEQSVLQDTYFYYKTIMLIFFIMCRTLIFLLFISLTIYYFRKASGYDKNEIITPNQKALVQQLQEIKNQLNKLVKQKKTFNDTQQLDKSFKGKAVVSWVLCSTNLEQKELCEELFNMLNQELKEIHEQDSDDSQSENSEQSSSNSENQDESELIESSQQSVSQDQQSSKTDVKQTRVIDSNEIKVPISQRNKLMPLEINPLLFDKTHQLIPFLESYFSIKPLLITMKSLNKFRIVIQNLVILTKKQQQKSQMYNYVDRDINLQQQQHNVTELIEYLKEVGCKVPLLLYFNNQFDDIQSKFLNRLKIKYDMFFWTNDIDKVKCFCRMESVSLLIDQQFK